MSFNVRWKRTAKDQLASIWITATDRAAVTTAAQQIDALLETNPASRGESRSGSLRVLDELPLAVVFKVLEQEAKVIVLSVRYTPPRP
jgi:plasmid stabilization system protein ParE